MICFTGCDEIQSGHPSSSPVISASFCLMSSMLDASARLFTAFCFWCLCACCSARKKHGHMPDRMIPLWIALACVADFVKFLSVLFGTIFVPQKLDELLNPVDTVGEMFAMAGASTNSEKLSHVELICLALACRSLFASWVKRLRRTKSVVLPKNHSLRVGMRCTLAERWRPETLICRVSDRWTNAVLTYVSNLALDQIRRQRRVALKFCGHKTC